MMGKAYQDGGMHVQHHGEGGFGMGYCYTGPWDEAVCRLWWRVMIGLDMSGSRD